MILELVHRAARYKYHILLDLRNAYNQIYLEPKYRFLTNFRFKNETYQWNVLPFGLSTAPSIFQSILNLLLEEKLNKGVDIYLDDIHIYANTKEECLELCAFVLKKFQENNFYCKLEKCIFFPTEFEYLGYKINYKNIKPTSCKVNILKPAQTLKEYQQLFGFINYFKDFIPNFTEKTFNISKGLRNPKTNWTKEMQEELNFFIDFIPNLPSLAPFQPNLDIFILTDASEYGIGASIFQVGDKVIQIKNFVYNNVKKDKSDNNLNNVQNMSAKFGSNNSDQSESDNKQNNNQNQNNRSINKKKTLSKSERKRKNNSIIPPTITLDKEHQSLAIKQDQLQKLKQYCKPIGFYSRKLNQTEQKYSTFDRELLALSETLEHYQLLLKQGQRIYSATDYVLMLVLQG